MATKYKGRTDTGYKGNARPMNTAWGAEKGMNPELPKDAIAKWQRRLEEGKI